VKSRGQCRRRGAARPAPPGTHPEARDVAGRQHFDPELTHAERHEEERRRKWGLRSLREELQTAELRDYLSKV
jgi:hypothetical protein